MAKTANYNCTNGKYTRNGGSWQGTSELSAGIASDGNTYITRLTFPGISLKGIKSVKLYVYRIDSYSSKTWKVTWSTSDGVSITGTNLGDMTTNAKAWNSMSLSGLVSSMPSSTFYIRLMHGSGSNSYGEIAGQGTSNQPYMVVEYDNGSIVKYYTGSVWRNCEIWYYTGSSWVQVEAKRYDGSAWKNIGE